ncbi:GTP-binding protein, partial [bacterium]
MISKPQIVIGTAGHIDHGKTSIVKLLTGTSTDTLKEEKNRGMTIDIGFAYLNNEITIIDVPGHERFIRNMVAGISTINIALIIVSADDGLMPQTHEHIEILHLLNIKHAIVVITKADKVENNIIDLVENEIKGRIQNTNFYNAKILRTSAKNNVGIDLLKK